MKKTTIALTYIVQDEQAKTKVILSREAKDN